MFVDKFVKALKSRGNWALVAIFVVGGVEAVSSLFPVELVNPILGVLAALTVYLKVNPSQDY